MNGNEQRELVSIVACTDGPLIVRGDVEIVDAAGEAIVRNRKTVALCRCGASTIKPFCDGTHKLVGSALIPRLIQGTEVSRIDLIRAV